jgi:hypothetical protein
MKSLAAKVSLTLTACILLAGTWLLTTSRLEYCERPTALQPQSASPTLSDAPTPTLAPPRKVVFVRVESDKPDLEVGWADGWPYPRRQQTRGF